MCLWRPCAEIRKLWMLNPARICCFLAYPNLKRLFFVLFLKGKAQKLPPAFLALAEVQRWQKPILFSASLRCFLSPLAVAHSCSQLARQIPTAFALSLLGFPRKGRTCWSFLFREIKPLGMPPDPDVHCLRQRWAGGKASKGHFLFSMRGTIPRRKGRDVQQPGFTASCMQL